MSLVLLPPFVLAAATTDHPDKAIVFFEQLLLLIVVGRLMGEFMQRMGQPAVMGQLLGGIILGPSVFGWAFPSVQHAIFPTEAGGREMLKAVSELGILMLLLLTGMETDLALVKRVRRSAAFTSAGGILLPFVCGYLLGDFMPQHLLPDPHRRLMTALFLATALSISSVKIVAAVLREVDFLRRDLGQVILASAILDDTIGWIILALIGGLAMHGQVEIVPLLIAVAGAVLFVSVAFTVGGGWVARLIRWSNDSFFIEMPVISVILVLMLGLALLTNAFGVQTVLGAFGAGIMIGQSPILTRHIEEQLRGLIVALFMPVFFGVAGLSIDMKVLADPQLALLTVLVICIASVGKLGGCYAGSRVGGLRHQEAVAVGFGMNARGSTEIILATIGLGLGVLNQQLFTVIVLMAIITTLCMPPLLRWALTRVELREDEKKRLETEAAEERETLPKIERLLVALDTREEEGFAPRLAGWLIGARNLSSTVLDWNASHGNGRAGTRQASFQLLEAAGDATRTVQALREKMAPKITQPASPLEVAAAEASKKPAPTPSDFVSVQTPSPDAKPEAFANAILTELAKGYGMIFLGASRAESPARFEAMLQKVLHDFAGPVAILFGRRRRERQTTLRKILVPTTGADYSRFGAEVAVAIAKGCGAEITAVHVAVSPEGDVLRSPASLLRTSRALVGDIQSMGKREGVHVEPLALRGRAKESALLRQAAQGHYDLIVIGSKSQSNERLHFGTSAMLLIEQAPCPVLIVKS